MVDAPGAPGLGGEAVAARVEALAARYRLPAGAADRLLTLLGVLAADELAPTTVREPDAIVDDHLADSLVALELDEIHAAGVIVDIGSGAGLPGLPLAIALPAVRVALVESSRRKCEFIERAIAACGLDNATVACARAEEWREGLGTADVVTARALASLAVVAEYGAPLLRVGGVLVAWRGRRDSEVEGEAAAAAAELGLELRPPLAVSPYPEARHRHLHLMLKVSSTPARFPRRAGAAVKRPLGAAATRPRDRIGDSNRPDV